MSKTVLKTKYRKNADLLQIMARLVAYHRVHHDIPDLTLSISALTTDNVGVPDVHHKNLLTAERVSEILGLSVKTLANWRVSGTASLSHVKMGRRVMYRRADVDAFVARNIKESTSQSNSTWGDI